MSESAETVLAPPSEPARHDEACGLCGEEIPDSYSTLGCLLAAVEDLNASLDLDQGLERVADSLAGTLPYDTLAILLDDGEGLRCRFERGFPEGTCAALAEPLVARALAERRTLVEDAAGELPSRAVFPLVAKGRTLGVLALANAEPGFFTGERRRHLKFLAGHLASALENARLYAATHRQAQDLALLHEVSRELASILDRETLLRRVADLIKRLIDYQLFCVMLWNESTQELESVLSVHWDGCTGRKVNVPLDSGLCGLAARERRPVRVGDVRREPRYRDCGDAEVRSELVLPLLIKDRLIGVLDLESYWLDAFSEENEKLLMTLASNVAIALENASLYERLKDDEARLAADLRAARKMQRFLLPRITPWLPGLRTAVAYCPARDLGGDLYDFLDYGPGRTAVAVGDVAGKGSGAALYGSMAVGLLRGYVADARCEPAAVLDYLNAELGQLDVERRFLALAFAVYDRESGVLKIANSGLPYPLLVRDGRVEEIKTDGVPVGAMASASYREISLALRPGDRVVFATDGVEECRGIGDEQFGGERLFRALEGLATASAQDVAQGVLAAADRFLGRDREPSDDRTVVVLEIDDGKPSPSDQHPPRDGKSSVC